MFLVDEQTKESQRQQLNAERERRATIATAEGNKRSIELNADAQLYEARKVAEAVKVSADAEAYAVKIKADADAEQTRVVGQGYKRRWPASYKLRDHEKTGRWFNCNCLIRPVKNISCSIRCNKGSWKPRVIAGNHYR